MPDDHTPDTPSERDRKAQDLAFAAGERRAEQAAINARHRERLDEVDAWRREINGSIRRGADATEAVDQKLDKIAASHRQLEEVRAAREEERNDLERARTLALKQASDRQISNRTFILGVIAILIPLIALLLSLQGGRL